MQKTSTQRILRNIIDKLSGSDKENCRYLLALGSYITNAVRTTINTKNWFKAKITLLNLYKEPICEETYKKCAEQINIMRNIAEREIENAQDTIPYVEFDSRLGFEPSMEYMCDKAHLLWKIEKTSYAIAEAVDEFNKTFKDQIEK